MIISQRQKVICQTIPKTASSSLKSYFKIHYPDQHTHLINTKEPFTTEHIYKYKKEFEGYYKFCIMRNPWNRMVSLYRNKILNPTSTKPSKLVKYYGFNSDMTFAEFVLHLITLDQKDLDVHAQPQYKFVFHNGINVLDYIGFLENLTEDWKTICVNAKIKHIPLRRNNRSRGEDYKYYYNTNESKKKDIKNIVSNYWKRDIELGGYEYDRAKKV